MTYHPHHTKPSPTGRKTPPMKHFVWRKHPRASAWQGYLPEVIGTDGRNMRRMHSQPRQIVLQQFEDSQTSAAVVEHIEASASPGASFAGYSLFEDQPAVAVLHTGQGSEPGWLAFPYRRNLLAPYERPTLPPSVLEQPRLRLVAGASIYWHQRDMLLHVAVEQRGNLGHQGLTSLLDHLEHVGIGCPSHPQGATRELHLIKECALRPLERTGPHRLEASFVIEPLILKEARRQGASVWLLLRFDAALFCLPDPWRTFWLELEVDRHRLTLVRAPRSQLPCWIFWPWL